MTQKQNETYLVRYASETLLDKVVKETQKKIADGERGV